MAWGKNGTPDTLTSAGDTLEISDLSANNFIQLLNHKLVDNNLPQINFRVGTGSVDTGSNYAYRRNRHGTEGTGGNVAFVQTEALVGIGTPSMNITYICNIAGEETLTMNENINANTAGAGTAPARQETVGKWATTTQIDTVHYVNTNTGDMGVDSNLSALGAD
jgi:hypothetical protein